ncbi:MAG TPA: sensor domain-containing diguanylate cyclase [Armatimonadota bacterium]|nr:sensor domain-containing diguanylate cyclase [Armatimonadota bacterium]
MKNHYPQVLDRVASVVRAVVLLTTTIMTRLRAYPGAPGLGLDLFLAFGGVYILVTAMAQHYARRHRPDTGALVSLDVFYITGLVWHTGGLHSEYYLLYYLPILNASMRLDFRQAIMSSALAGLCYALIMVAGGLESTVVSTAALQLATFGGSALVLALFFGTVATLSRGQRQLTDRLERAVERLSALYRVARAVHTENGLQSVADTTLELALELSCASAGYLALSGEAGQLTVMATRVAAGEHETGRDFGQVAVTSRAQRARTHMCEQPPFDLHLAEHCLVQRAPTVTDPLGRHPELNRPGDGCCAVSVPLAYGDHTYGALQLFSRSGDTFAQAELELLTALTQEAAVAIENARLATEVRRLSVTDELTGLYHRSEFRRLLTAEVEAARVNGAPIAVVLFDVDGMRGINSEHGHAAGDAVLLAFADLLRRYVRSQDIVARFGGDELAVLLPHGGIDAARAVSTRVCQAMAHREFRFEGEDEAHCVTLCAGAVVAREMPSNADQLIGRADEALFEAREAGAGQIRFWEATVRRGIVTEVGRIVERMQDSSQQWR